MNFCWSVWKWTVLPAVVIAAAAGIAVYSQLDDQIRKHAEQLLSKAYPDLVVEVASARRVEGRGIEIRGVKLSRYDEQGQESLVEIEEIMLVCSASLPDLMQQNLQTEEIVLRRPRIRARQQASGKWNVACLVPFPKFGNSRPKIVVDDATLDICDPTKTKQLSLREISLTLSPCAQPVTRPGAPPAPPPPPDSFAAKLQARSAAGKAASGSPSGVPADPYANLQDLTGSAVCRFAQRIDLRGAVDPVNGTWIMQGTASGVQIGPELAASIPCSLPPQATPLSNVRAQGSVQFEVRSPLPGEKEIDFNVSCSLSGGRLDDARLPYPLTEVEINFHAEPKLLSVDQLTARCGQGTVSLMLQRQGYDAAAPMMIAARLRNVSLDERLKVCLPGNLAATWEKYEPEGRIDADLRLDYDGVAWKKDIAANCLDVAFRFHKFPYRLERMTGPISLKSEHLSANLTAYTGPSPVSIRAELDRPGPLGVGWVEIRSTNMPIDDKLIEAISEKGRPIVRSLNPSGQMQIYWRGWREPGEDLAMHQHLLMSYVNASIRFDKFPYPLAGIRGTVEMHDDRWFFHGLEGTNDTGLVTCKGHTETTQQGRVLILDLAATELPLEEELRNALQPGAQRLWDELKPRGSADITAQVMYGFDQPQLSVNVRIEPRKETSSIEPASMPYRLDKLNGVILYRDGEVTLESIQGEHGATRFSATGKSRAMPDASWYLYLDNLIVEGMQADRELLLALPPTLRHVISKMNPTGRISMQGAFGLAKGAASYAPLESRWNLTFNLHQASFECGQKLTDIYGDIQLAGSFDGKQLQSRGELDLDSLIYRNMQFTEVRGPLFIDNSRALLGVWAEEQNKPNPRRITARAFDGTIVADAWAVLEEVPRFGIQGSLINGNLSNYARETLPGHETLKGTVFGDLELHGDARGLNSLQGSGNIRLRDADIGQLSQTVQLLKVLGGRVPDNTAFTTADMKFRILGTHIYMDTLNLLGDAVSLFGRGEVDFNREIQLTFHTTVGRNEIPVLKTLVGAASSQIMKIHVTGNMDAPVITNEMLPGVNQLMQGLQRETVGASAPAGSSTR